MPPKNKKKDTKKKELSEDDMRRLGMTEEDIARIIAERSKSSVDKKAEQEKEETQRRENEARARMQKEYLKAVDAVVKDEADPRVAILKEEDEAWNTLAAPLTVEKTRLLRVFAEKEIHRKIAEARKKRAEDLEAWKASLGSMSEEQRQQLIAEQEEKERERQEEIVRQEEARRLKQERREAKRQARAERMRKSGMTDTEAYLTSLISSDDDDGDGSTSKVKSKQQAKQKELDDLDFAMREWYER